MWLKTSMDRTTAGRNPVGSERPWLTSKLRAHSLSMMIFPNLPYTIARPPASELMYA